MKKLLFVALLLSGCSTVQPVYTRNGEQAHRIACPGVGMQYCYEKALAVCQGGYFLLEDLSRPTSSGINIKVVAGQEEAALIIKCKG